MADDPTPDPVDDPTPEPVADPTPNPDQLGEGGKKALDAERKRANAEAKRAKALEDELAEIRAANQSKSEKAIEAAKAEGRTEATAAADKRIVRAEVKALASSKLTDPNDAALHLDLSQFTVDADGNVDEQAISSAIDELVASKPYLAGVATTPRPGNGDGGVRTPAPTQTLAEQIAKAEQDGDWALSTQLKSRQLMQLGNTT